MIQVRNLSKSFLDKVVFSNVCLDLPDTGLFLLCGPNGCGKSTLIYILAGLDTDFIGQVIINGQDIKALDDKSRIKLRKENVGLLFSHGNLFSFLNVEDNVELDSKGNRNTIKKELREKKPYVLSGGEEAMVSLINEFHKKKKIYLIDELTSALNDDNVQRVMTLILEQSKNSLILMATHDKRIMGMGEKIIIEDINK